MKHLLDENQKKEFMGAIKREYNNFKRSFSFRDEKAWKEGVTAVFDSFIQASAPLTYDISSLWADVEYMLDEMDNEE